MNTIRLIASLALLTAPTVWSAERVESPLESAGGTATPESAPAIATSLPTEASQVPLLFVIDGVRYPRGQEPLLSSDQIFAVRVIKGRAAIQRYGQDASYGVVLIITRQAAGPRA
jgi:hypothetical protein